MNKLRYVIQSKIPGMGDYMDESWSHDYQKIYKEYKAAIRRCAHEKIKWRLVEREIKDKTIKDMGLEVNEPQSMVR